MSELELELELEECKDNMSLSGWCLLCIDACFCVESNLFFLFVLTEGAKLSFKGLSILCRSFEEADLDR